MTKPNTKKKHQQRDFGKRYRALELRRQNAKGGTSPLAKAAVPKELSVSGTDLRTIEAIRAYAAEVMKDCKTTPRTDYDAGFQEASKEIGRMLDPEGYSCARPMNQLVAALQKGPGVNSKANLQSVEAVRHFLLSVLTGFLNDPSDRPSLYGYEDAHWRMWRMVTGGNVAHRDLRT